MKIAVFGGSFDPPHLGHQAVASSLLDQKLADEVWFVPVKQHPFAKAVGSAADRVAMLKLITQKIPHTRVEEFELHQMGPSYTFTTLQHFAQQHPEHSFTFIIGADNLPKFDHWHQYQELLKNFPVLVYPRVKFELQPLFPNMQALSGMAPVAVSSTEVRQKINVQQPLTGLVDPAVEQYIKDHALYVTDTSTSSRNT